MKDGTDETLDRLIRAARGFQPDDALGGEHFETRVMAGIRDRQRSRGTWVFWAWRLAPGFAILAAILGVVSLTMEPGGPVQDAVAAVLSGNENRLIARYLIGG